MLPNVTDAPLTTIIGSRELESLSCRSGRIWNSSLPPRPWGSEAITMAECREKYSSRHNTPLAVTEMDVEGQSQMQGASGASENY